MALWITHMIWLTWRGDNPGIRLCGLGVEGCFQLHAFQPSGLKKSSKMRTKSSKKLMAGWPTPLKNMSSSVGVTIPSIYIYIWKHKIHVPNHQPVCISSSIPHMIHVIRGILILKSLNAPAAYRSWFRSASSSLMASKAGIRTCASRKGETLEFPLWEPITLDNIG